ncbi:hypothetical protein ABIB35_002175 [Arthrobacter sp. UYP6]|uniref:hypothetical protein n=1 Tax=Arthrobacter sp. UYP6 TaxID=1756378 RepID=UPI00339192EF
MTLQWIAFGVTVFFGLLRLPGAIRGENRGLFCALIILAVVMALSIPPFYLAVDSVLGGVNIANLLIRYCSFATVVILGAKVAAAFNAPRVQRLIAGQSGLTVLGLAAAAVAVLFFVSDLPESSPALAAYWDQGTVNAYGDTSRLYQAYVAACLVPALALCSADRRRRKDIRISAGLMSLGGVLTVVHSLLILSLWDMQLVVLDRVLPYTAVIVISIGLALIWNSQRVAKRVPQTGSLAQVNGAR